MATANKQFNARIQLKHDTEANWQTTSDFTPLNGELIIYEADENHPYCRVKIGDGRKRVNQLPFIDSGTVNGEDEFIMKYNSYSEFPQPGSSKKLYIDLSTKDIYHYSSTLGYTKLMSMTLDVQKASATMITNWNAGKTTEASILNNTLILDNGYTPSLTKYNISVVTDVTKGVNE